MKIASTEKYNKHTAINVEIHRRSVRPPIHKLIVFECPALKINR